MELWKRRAEGRDELSSMESRIPLPRGGYETRSENPVFQRCVVAICNGDQPWIPPIYIAPSYVQ